ncbi:MAG: hypothetical protein F8N39_07455, partial [Clostridiaceae bacterium]|nr:hypothetical protein [Clostridiaceae bacterium]
MKLNKREKALLSVLAGMLLIGGYYKFVLAPQREKINNLTKQKEEYNRKLQDINRQIALKSKIETDTKILNSKIQSMTLMLFPSIQQENFIVVIDKLLKDANLRGVTLSFSDIKAVPVEQVKTEEKDEKTSSLKNTVDEYNGLPVKKQDNKKADNNNNNK